MPDRLLSTHVFEGARPGPRLVVLGAVHGNETCGTRAMERLLPQLASGAIRIAAGRLTLVPVTNRKAYEQGTRTGDRNLNRSLLPTPEPRDNEERIANELCPLLAQHDVLLDLHSFHSPGEPFVMLGPEDNQGPLEPFSHASEEEALALRLGVGLAVDGWLDTYAAGVARRGGNVDYGVGTTEFMRREGGWGLTLECGRHDDPRAPDVAEAAILRTLAHLGLVDAPAPAVASRMRCLRLESVVDRDDAGDRFAREWASFDPVGKGELIGRRATGEEVRASADGFIVFPNPGALPGAEWFYFARAHPRLARGGPPGSP